MYAVSWLPSNPGNLVLPSIGWQLFILDSSQSDPIALPAFLDTYATRLLTEPLTKRRTESARTVPWGGAPSPALRAAAKFREFTFYALGCIRARGGRAESQVAPTH